MGKVAPLSPSTSPQGTVQRLWVSCFAWYKEKKTKVISWQLVEPGVGKRILAEGEDVHKPELQGENGHQETAHRGE